MTHFAPINLQRFPRPVAWIGGGMLIAGLFILIVSAMFSGQSLLGQVTAFQSGKHLDENIVLLDSDRHFLRPLTAFSQVSIDAYDWHPSGESIIMSARYLETNAFNLYRVDLQGKIQRLNSDETTWDLNPLWSPTGDQLAFLTNRGSGLRLYVMAADGSNLRRLSRLQVDAGNFDWSPDGTQIAAVQRDGIWLMNPDNGELTLLTNVPGFEREPRWSEDGASITFRTGDFEFYRVEVLTGATQAVDWSTLPPELLKSSASQVIMMTDNTTTALQIDTSLQRPH